MKAENDGPIQNALPESSCSALLGAAWKAYVDWRDEARRIDEELQEATAAFKHAERRRQECWENYRTLRNKLEASNND